MDSPTNYVNTQLQHNLLHRDGSCCSFEEAAKDYMKDFALRIKEWEGPQADPSMLDAGCRLGYALPVYIEQFPAARVVGVDIVPEFIDIAARESEALVADLGALPFEDDEFDYAFCCQTIEHTLEPPLAARELLRVTKKGIFVSIPLETTIEYEHNPSHHMQSENPLDWMQLFRDPFWRVVWASQDTGNDFNFILRRIIKDELDA